MRVYWTDTAIGHLDAIYAHISQDSKAYALNMVDRITSRTMQLSVFPISGRCVPEYARQNIREIFEGAYRIIYIVKEGQIDILAVVHGAMILPGDLD